MKTTIPFLIFGCLLFQVNLFAQTQGVAYPAVGKGVATTFVTDYHSNGINSSMLGWGTGYEGKRFTMGTTEFSLGIYSDQLDSEKLGKLFTGIRNDMMGKEQGGANWQEQKEYASEYSRAGISIDFSYNWLGFSFQSEKFGGIAFNVQESMHWYSKTSDQTTDLIFNGRASQYFDQLTVVYGDDTTVINNDGNVSQDTLDHVAYGTASVPLQLSALTSGSEIQYAWNRYYNFGYGKKLFGDSTFALSAGIGGRFIQSTALFSMTSDASGIRMYSSISPNSGIDYGAIAESNSSTYTQKGSIPKTVGNGYGVDVSLSARLFSKLTVGLAVNNLGSVTYKRNVYRVRDTLIANMSMEGLTNYNITGSLNQFLEDGGLLVLEGEEKVTINNAANIRLGAKLAIGKIANVGVDFVAPFNTENPGGIQNPVYSIGGDIRPVKWLVLSAGYFGGGIYEHNIPLGINFVLKGGTYEFGISSRDALSFFTKGSNSISSAFGVGRFRF